MAGFVFAVHPDDRAQAEARKAGRRDGAGQPPPQGTAPKFIEQMRSGVAAANSQRAQATQNACRQPVLQANDCINRGSGRKTQALYFTTEVRKFILRFDQNKEAALKSLAVLEGIYLEEAIAGWDARGQFYAIPPPAFEDEIADLRRTFESLARRVEEAFDVHIDSL